MVITFDGINKIISLPLSTPEVAVVEIYSRWVDWAATSDNIKYLQAMRFVGGDVLPGSKQLGITYFMLNGWKIRPAEESYVLTINGNLYAEDGSSPFIPVLGNYNITIINSVSSLVDSTIQQLPEIEYASYENRVIINTINGVSGTAYPIGTRLLPVNNLQDALLILSNRGFLTIEIESNLLVTSGSNIDNLIIISQDYEHELTIELGASCVDTTFKTLSLNGVLSGDWNIFIDCWLYNVTNFCGWMQAGSFEYIELAPFNVESNGQSYFDNIVPMYPEEHSIITMNTDTSVSFTNISGYFSFNNFSEGSSAYVGISSGIVRLNNSCTGGYFEISGSGLFINNSVGVVINQKALFNDATVWNALKNESGVSGSYGDYIKTLGGAGSNIVSVHANYIARVIGSDQGGTIDNIQAHDDSYFSTGEILGQGLAVVLEATTNPTYIPSTLRLSGFYAGSSSHFIVINVYNFILNIHESKGVMLSRSTPSSYTIPLDKDNIDTNGTIRVELMHSTSTYISNHRLHIDYVQFDLTNTFDSLSSDIASIKNRTDQLSFTLGRINSNTQMISDNLTSADLLENNVLNIDLPISNLDIKLNTILDLNSDIISNTTNIDIDLDVIQNNISALNTTSSGVLNTVNTLTNEVQELDNDIQTLSTEVQALDIPTISNIVTAVWNHSKANQISSDVSFVKSIEGGKWEIKNNQMIFYAENNTTELARFNLYNDVGVLAEESIFKRVRV